MNVEVSTRAMLALLPGARVSFECRGHRREGVLVEVIHESVSGEPTMKVRSRNWRDLWRLRICYVPAENNWRLL